MHHDYGIVFCGGGPAAIGPIVCAAVEGRLEALLDRGVCVVERGARIGPGSIGHYPISANTRGNTFMRFLAAPQLARVRDDPATHKLERLRYVFPRLPLVGEHLEALGAAVHALLDAHPRCSVLTGHRVEELRALPGGGLAVTGGSLALTAGRAVIAMGGRPLPVPYASAKTCHADLLLDDRKGLPEELERGIAETGEAVVVGGSHSAWSAAWLLLRRPARPRVTVLHRTPRVSSTGAFEPRARPDTSSTASATFARTPAGSTATAVCAPTPMRSPARLSRSRARFALCR